MCVGRIFFVKFLYFLSPRTGVDLQLLLLLANVNMRQVLINKFAYVEN